MSSDLKVVNKNKHCFTFSNTTFLDFRGFLRGIFSFHLVERAETPKETKLGWKKYFTLSWPRKCLTEARTCTRGTAEHQPGHILLQLAQTAGELSTLSCSTFRNCFYPPPWRGLYGCVELNQFWSLALPCLWRALHAEGQLYGIFFLISNRISLVLNNSQRLCGNGICTAADSCGMTKLMEYDHLRQKSRNVESKMPQKRLVLRFSAAGWLERAQLWRFWVSHIWKTVQDVIMNNFAVTLLRCISCKGNFESDQVIYCSDVKCVSPGSEYGPSTPAL